MPRQAVRTRRSVELHQLEPSGVSSIASSARTPSIPTTRTVLDRPLALQLESKLDDERRRGREVVDHH